MGKNASRRLSLQIFLLPPAQGAPDPDWWFKTNLEFLPNSYKLGKPKGVQIPLILDQCWNLGERREGFCLWYKISYLENGIDRRNVVLYCISKLRVGPFSWKLISWTLSRRRESGSRDKTFSSYCTKVMKCQIKEGSRYEIETFFEWIWGEKDAADSMRGESYPRLKEAVL